MTLKALFAALALSASVFATAQYDSFDMQIANQGLLLDHAVQVELGITPEQGKAIFKAGQAEIPAIQKAKNNQSQIAAIQANTRKAMLGAISGAQLRRLRELTLQGCGFQVVATPVIAAKIGLSNAQRDSVRAVYVDAMQNAMAEIHKKADDATKELRQRQPRDEGERQVIQRQMLAASKQAQVGIDFNEVRREADLRAAAILTPQQSAAWKALLGKVLNKPATVIHGGGA